MSAREPLPKWTGAYICSVCHKDRQTSASAPPERCYPCQMDQKAANEKEHR